MSDYYIKLGRRSVAINDWANWLGQDEDGLWWEYSRKPHKYISKYQAMWMVPDPAKINELARTKPPADWTQELYQIERQG